MRAAKIEELGGISVWEWLGGQKIVSPSNPLFKGPIRPSHKSVDDSLRELGLDKKTAWTEEEIKKLVSELKETSPAPVAHFIRAIHNASAEGAFSEAHIRRTVESVVSMLPPDVANALTSKKLTLSVLPASTWGRKAPLADYNSLTHEIRLNRDGIRALVGDQKTNVAERIFHEMGHWIHMNGPQWYKDAIEKLYDSRTAGEPAVWSHTYQVWVKRDRWYDEYAGAVNKLEVVTRHFQLLANPRKMELEMSKQPNGSTIAENLKTILKIFYEQP